MLPAPAEAPVTFVSTTVHAKVVPDKLPSRLMFVVWPLQIVWLDGVAEALGLPMVFVIAIWLGSVPAGIVPMFVFVVVSITVTSVIN